MGPIAVFDMIKRYTNFLILATLSAALWVNSSRAQEFGYDPMLYSVKLGLTMPNSPSLLERYWYDAANIEGGIRLPYCLLCEYSELWVYASYNHFLFQKGSHFPIDSFDQRSVVELKGEPVKMFSAYAGARISFLKLERRVVPYLFYGYGYIIRSDLVFDSDSQLFSYFSKQYDNSFATMYSFGLDMALSARMRLVMEISGTAALTGDKDASYYTGRVGLALR